MNSLVRHNAKSLVTGRRGSPLSIGKFARIIIGCALLAASAGGAFLFVNGGGPGVSNPPSLEGTWELATLGGAAPADGHLSGVLAQRVAFRGGTVRGETLVLTDTGSTSQKLPFPDETVDRVVPSSDGAGVRILWSGSYETADREQVTLHIGKAVYFVRLTWRDGGETPQFNQDVILTYPGTAAYRRASTARMTPPSQNEAAQTIR
jgi:hypothetical protein